MIMLLISGIVVVFVGAGLIGVAVMTAIKPVLTERFLNSFASSARAHYTEQAVRLIAGGAIVTFASSMWYPNVFMVFGWIILGSTAGLLLIPWQWHHKFGTWAIPLAIRHIKLYAIGSFVLGALILYGVSRVMVS
jgi:hypothetical protein